MEQIFPISRRQLGDILELGPTSNLEKQRIGERVSFAQEFSVALVWAQCVGSQSLLLPHRSLHTDS